MTTDDRVAEILSAWQARREAGESVDPENVIRAHPQFEGDLRAQFAALQILDLAVLERLEEATRSAAPDDEPGTRMIGPYRIERLLGSGGMGRVYLADQEEPIRRQVALKVLGGQVSDLKSRARFELEREALSLMDHPYIAPVYDAGLAQDGTPYVAMAYVKGEAITTYCAEYRIDLDGRLEIFAKVCEAVQHAHQKGVIHRDIKPSNVLVTGANGDASPRVIDFGLAKPHGATLGLDTQLTIGDQVLGTPAYMSPEQAGGKEGVDVRTDVYALGILLYELLTDDVPWGRTELTRRNLATVLRRILEEDPPKPSTHVSTLRDRAESDAGTGVPASPFPIRNLRGDLDWIVMKAIAKERDRRYPSAQELADDVRRHLRDEPVRAGPPSGLYRLMKFVRRHRAGVTAAAIVLVTLVAGLLTSLALYADARDARHEAEQNAREEKRQRGIAEESSMVAVAANRRALENLTELRAESERLEAVSELFASLSSVPISKEGGQAVTLLDGLRAAERDCRHAYRGQPQKLAAMELAIGQALVGLGQPEAVAHLREAVSGFRDTLGWEHPQTLRAAYALARKIEGAELEVLARQAMAGSEKTEGPNSDRTLRFSGHLGLALVQQGRFPEAEKILRSTVQRSREHVGANHVTTLTSLGWLARALRDDGGADAVLAELMRGILETIATQDARARRALPLAHEALRLDPPEAGAATPITTSEDALYIGTALGHLAWQLDTVRLNEASLAVRRRGFEVLRDHVGFEHRETQIAGQNLYIYLRERSSAEELREALEIAKAMAQVQPENTQWLLFQMIVLNRLANQHGAADRVKKALEMQRVSLGLGRRAVRARPGELLFVHNLAIALRKVGHFLTRLERQSEARVHLEEARGLLRRLDLEAGPVPDLEVRLDLSRCARSFGDSFAREGRLNEALESYREALAIYEALAKASPKSFTAIEPLRALVAQTQARAARGK